MRTVAGVHADSQVRSCRSCSCEGWAGGGGGCGAGQGSLGKRRCNFASRDSLNSSGKATGASRGHARRRGAAVPPSGGRGGVGEWTTAGPCASAGAAARKLPDVTSQQHLTSNGSTHCDKACGSVRRAGTSDPAVGRRCPPVSDRASAGATTANLQQGRAVECPAQLGVRPRRLKGGRAAKPNGAADHAQIAPSRITFVRLVQSYPPSARKAFFDCASARICTAQQKLGCDDDTPSLAVTVPATAMATALPTLRQVVIISQRGGGLLLTLVRGAHPFCACVGALTKSG